MSKYFVKTLPVPDGFRRVVKSNGIPVDYEYEIASYICQSKYGADDSVCYVSGSLIITGKVLKVTEFGEGNRSKILFKTKKISDVFPNDFLVEEEEVELWEDECYKVIGKIEGYPTPIDGTEFEENQLIFVLNQGITTVKIKK